MDFLSRPLDPISQAVASFRLASSRNERIQSFFLAALSSQRAKLPFRGNADIVANAVLIRKEENEKKFIFFSAGDLAI